MKLTGWCLQRTLRDRCCRCRCSLPATHTQKQTLNLLDVPLSKNNRTELKPHVGQTSEHLHFLHTLTEAVLWKHDRVTIHTKMKKKLIKSYVYHYSFLINRYIIIIKWLIIKVFTITMLTIYLFVNCIIIR